MYRDKDANEIREGHILKYDEGVDYSRGVHLVQNTLQGTLGGETKLMFEDGEWRATKDIVIDLVHYTPTCGNVTTNATIIGHIDDTPELLTIQGVIEFGLFEVEEPLRQDVVLRGILSLCESGGSLSYIKTLDHYGLTGEME